VSEGIVLHAIMASLTENLSDRDAAALWDQWLPALAGNSLIAQVGSLMRPSPAVWRGMWRTARGRDQARKMAFLQLPLADYYRTPLVALMVEMIRQEALGGQATPAQDELLWQTTRACLEGFFQGKLAKGQALQLAFTYKGTTGFLGWGGVATRLGPALRGPLAYFFGHLYLRRKHRGDARKFFRTALEDAPAGSPLQGLARDELTRLDSK
jgi:hypothetical protein